MSLIEDLQGAVGADNVLTDGDLSAFEVDWRKRYRGRALAVVRPASAAEVAAVMRCCARHRAPVVAQGGNTGLVGGSIPDQSGRQVLLSLARMNRIHHLDAANLTVTVEAGCVLQTLQEACESAGFLYPLSMASEGSCTVGGNLGTNAGGTQVVRYGNTRELCLGLEVVTPAGEVWHGLTGLRKDNTGYDLRHLFIGSEGTLGVITAATMKLFPLPKTMMTAYASVPSLDAAVELLGLAQQHLSSGLTGFEVMGQFALSLVRKHFPQLNVPFAGDDPFCVVLEVSDHDSEAHARALLEALLEGALQDGCVLDAVVAQTQAQARALWHIRESIPLAQAQEGLNIKHDISIAVSRIPKFVDVTDALLVAALPGIRLVNFGHLGDGNLHYNVQAPAGANGAAFLRDHEEQVNALVYDSVMQFGGSISAEHGVGSLKLDKLEQHKSPVALGMMRAVKQALDPHNLMNPGRVIRV